MSSSDPGEGGSLFTRNKYKPQKAAELDSSLRRYVILPATTFGILIGLYAAIVQNTTMAYAIGGISGALLGLVIGAVFAGFLRYDAYMSGGPGWNE